jgi:hypothetical protein
MFLPLINAVWLSLIKESAMGVILSHSSLGKILKSTFKKQMGMYYLILFASLISGLR